jgi:N-acetylglucosamine malate deacetylase 1
MSATYDALIFSAHPDDAEMAMGGTMIRLIRAGYSVINVCLTRGEKGTYGDADIRSQEFNEASKLIGCACQQLDFPDTEIENTAEARKRLAALIRAYAPRVVFAPYHTNPLGELGGISNRDHYTTGSLVRDAVKLARLTKAVPDMLPHTVNKLYFYMIPRNVWAQLIVDVSEVIDETVNAISAYKSQMSINYLGNDIRHILLTMRESVGLHAGLRYAESFTTDLPLRMAPSSFFDL